MGTSNLEGIFTYLSSYLWSLTWSKLQTILGALLRTISEPFSRTMSSSSNFFTAEKVMQFPQSLIRRSSSALKYHPNRKFVTECLVTAWELTDTQFSFALSASVLKLIMVCHTNVASVLHWSSGPSRRATTQSLPSCCTRSRDWQLISSAWTQAFFT